MPPLADDFSHAVRAALAECHRLDYRPTRFEQMLETTDAVRLAKRMVRSGELQQGLKRLHDFGRVDLAIESILLRPNLQSLFSHDELDAARWRLSRP